MKIRLEPTDSHWIRINDPDGVASELDDWWENNARKGEVRATIDIRIPEVVGVGGKAKIRWYSNDWHHIGLAKSKDGKTFTEIWGRGAHYNFDETYEIELDPECEYYRIYFADGNGYYEVTRVYKDIEVIIPTLCEAKLIRTYLNKTEFKPDEDLDVRCYYKNTGNITTNIVIKSWIDGKPLPTGYCYNLPPGKISSSATYTYAPKTPGSYKVILVVEACGKETDRREIPFTVIEEKKEAIGDITKVELDSQLLPEDGTLDWIAGKQAAIRVYFKNVGNAPGKFHIWVTDEDGVKLCDVTTSTEIPADGVERYVTCGKFTPTEVEKKTLTAHIEP